MLHNHIELVLEDNNATHATAFLKDGVSSYSKKTRESFLEDGYIVLPDKEGMKLIFENEEKKYLNKWSEITEEAYFRALEELPPMRWKTVQGFEFFFCEEAYTGNIHSCYCSVENKYYSAMRRTTSSYESMIDELRGENYGKQNRI